MNTCEKIGNVLVCLGIAFWCYGGQTNFAVMCLGSTVAVVLGFHLIFEGIHCKA